MQKIAFLFLLLFAVTGVNATNYYLSSSDPLASDGYAVSSATNPWQTISKLNTVTYSPGDTVFFKCNDVFRGMIQVNQTGTSAANIVFTSYGSGNKPIINGSVLLTGWTPSGSYYTAPYTGTVTNFFVNRREQTLARYPNEHSYLSLDSAQTSYLKDASLSSISSSLITGSKICVHSSQWSWEKSTISSFSGTKISYGSLILRAINEYGYFLYDNLSHLDTANEWKYDASGNTLYYYPPSGLNPNAATCEISIYQNGIQLGANVSYLTISNLAFAYQSNAGIQIGNSNNRYITVNNCYFTGQYNHGINVKGRYCTISNSTFRDIGGIAVYVNGSGAGATTVDHNSFNNNGVTRVSGIGGQLNGTALMCSGDSNYFHHNQIDSTGYCGISADGAYNTVERNIIDHAMLIENDGAAIKGWESGTHHSVYRNNFVRNSDGTTEGTYNATFITPAIYFDFNVNNCTISDNTVYDHTQKGIFQNSSNHDNTITGNVIYGGSNSLDLNGTSLAPGAVPISGMTIKRNSFFAKDNNGLIIRQIDYTGAFNAGTIDSNYYFQPYNVNRYAFRVNGSTPTYYTFTNWQATGNDAHTKKSFVSWTLPVSQDTLIMNPTDNVVSIYLGTNYFLDLDSNIVCGSITLQPYTSKILIKTSNSCALLAVETIQQVSAIKVNDGVDVSWKSNNELNCSYYEVERSSDGISFEKMATVTAKGTAAQTNTYSVKDLTPINGTNYYKVKSVARDGSYQYSKTVTVNFRVVGISIVPNPATTEFTVRSEQSMPDTKVSLINMQGALVKTFQLTQNSKTISVKDLPTGIYIVKLVLNGSVITNRLLISK